MLARAKLIFEEALKVEPARRSALLDERCGDDAAARNLVERLLNADARAEIVFDGATSAAMINAQIGNCVVRRLIGSGGMGVVYEALQIEPHRLVALKVIHPSLVARDGLARFRHETSILGYLEHPGIARIYEAGVHDTGSQMAPYFVMELVEDASPLIAYANHVGLGIAARLRLFLQVCDAVQFAHQRGIIHRDLKPDNILVDGHQRARLIDFGIARTTDVDLSLVTLPSESGQLLGTIRYMSPEQLRGDVSAVDSRSDLYSLGVILYELLSGQFPFDLTGSTVFDIPRLVRESQPRRLGALNRDLAGDVDAIVSKVMDKEPARRYASVGEFAADIRRYLGDEAVEARRGLRWYVFRKTLHRYRVAVTITAGLLIFLLSAAIALGVMYEQVRSRGDELAAAVAEVDRARLSPLTSFEDSFADGPVDPDLYRIEDGGAFRVWRDDKLVLEKSPDWPGTSMVVVGSPRRALFGDFDVEVDWEVNGFDATDGSHHWAGLELQDARTGTGRAGIRRIAGRRGAAGDPSVIELGHWLVTYHGDVQPGAPLDANANEQDFQPTDAREGRFAIRRRGDTADLRFTSGGAWRSLGTAVVGTGPVFPVIASGSVTPESKNYAAFDNLRVALAPPVPIQSERFRFDGDRLDERFTIDLGWGGLPYVAHGALVMDKGAGSLSGPTIYLDPNRSVIRGDFEISVKYELVDFPMPQRGNAQVGMRLRRASDQTYFATVTFMLVSPERAEWRAAGGRDGGPSGVRPATVDDGALRITRRDATVEVSAWAGSWQVLLTCDLDRTDVIVGLFLYASADTTRRVIRFDDLRIEAADRSDP